MPLSHLGRGFESLAVEDLVRHGWSIVDRNYRSPWGEIDIIAVRAQHVCFVEVRKRRQSNALESVDSRKQKRISMTAEHWLLHHDDCFDELSFAVCAYDEAGATWVYDAFEYQDG